MILAFLLLVPLPNWMNTIYINYFGSTWGCVSSRIKSFRTCIEKYSHSNVLKTLNGDDSCILVVSFQLYRCHFCGFLKFFKWQGSKVIFRINLKLYIRKIVFKTVHVSSKIISQSSWMLKKNIAWMLRMLLPLLHLIRWGCRLHMIFFLLWDWNLLVKMKEEREREEEGATRVSTGGSVFLLPFCLKIYFFYWKKKERYFNNLKIMYFT